jgi:hypothetical protein
LASPTITTVTVTPTIGLNLDGSLVSSVPLTAKTTGLAPGASITTGDKVYASFKVVDELGEPPKTVAVPLTSADGSNWNGSIPTSAHTFTNGTQYITFSALRSADGKANSLVSQKVTLQGAAATPTPPPEVVSWSAVSSDGGSGVKITPGGALVPATVDLAVTTTNATEADSVQAVFPTRAGAVTAELTTSSCPVTQATCHWSGTIPREAGYSFTTGTKLIHFTVSQAYTVAGSGSTSTAERSVVFSL